MFPRGFADEVRQQTDIVRIVSDYVALKKRGANWIACCPFHSEKTPSFNVHSGKGIFKCFGCGAGGNVFDFVMRLEGCSFVDSVRMVAEKCGIPVPQETKPSGESQKADRWRKRLLELNELAAEFFEEQLGASPEGRRALEYLEERGISSDTRARLRLGYAPNAWEALSTFLGAHGVTRDEIADSGLVTVKEGGGGYYDRFRGRVMFPIQDAQGRVVAFGGRTMVDERAKYLNSPETAVYTKGNQLYGIFHAKEAIRRTGFAILVEGYLDFITPFQAGIENVVASLGTALTEPQARLLRRYMQSPRVVVNFDADSAGQEATTRSFEVLLGQGFKVNVLALSAGKDPDQFIREHGSSAYRDLLKQTKPYLDYVVDRAVSRYEIDRPSGKADALEEVLPFVAQIENRIERVEYAERIARRLGIDDDVLRKELRRVASRRETKIERNRVEPPRQLSTFEQRFLVVLFGDENVRFSVLQAIDEADIEGLASEPIFRAMLDAHRSGEPIGYAEISEKLSERSREDLASLLSIDVKDIAESGKGSWEDNLMNEANRCFERLHRTRYERELEKLSQQIRLADVERDFERVDQLLLQTQAVKLKLAELIRQR